MTCLDFNALGGISGGFELLPRLDHARVQSANLHAAPFSIGVDAKTRRGGYISTYSNQESVTNRQAESIPKQVRRRRDREQIVSALRARQLSGEETLSLGLELSDLAVRTTRRQHDERIR